MSLWMLSFHLVVFMALSKCLPFLCTGSDLTLIGFHTLRDGLITQCTRLSLASRGGLIRQILLRLFVTVHTDHLALVIVVVVVACFGRRHCPHCFRRCSRRRRRRHIVRGCSRPGWMQKEKNRRQVRTCVSTRESENQNFQIDTCVSAPTPFFSLYPNRRDVYCLYSAQVPS